MNDEFRLDPDTLRRDGARLAELGERVGRTYAELQDCLAATNGCWGDDDLGEAFAKDFTPRADQLLASLRAMEESLRGTSQQVADAALDFESVDLGGADRVGRAADEFRSPDPDYGTGTQPSSATAPTPAQDPVTSSPAPSGGAADGASIGQSTSATPPGASAGPSASRNSPQSTSMGTPDWQGGAKPAEESTSATPPGASAGPSASRNSPQFTSMGTPDWQGGAKPAQDPNRRPRSSAVSPPDTRRDAPRNPSTVSDRRGATPARNAGSAVGARRESPWTRPPATLQRGSTAAEPDSSDLRSDSPPRSGKGDQQRKRDRRHDTERPVGKPGASPLLVWLARTLGDRHGVAVVGFDLPGLQETPVREFAAAVDRVLTDYPAIVLDVVAVAELGDDAASVRWGYEPRDSAAARSITLDRRVACEPSRGAVTLESEAGSDDPAVYAATVRELGLALNSAGGGVARRTAQHTLIAEYMRVMAGRYTTLAELLHGYRRWRAGLTGATGEAGGFDAHRALGAAFADVVLHSESASAPAKALHAALVDAARPPG
ncbi:hypothetical protein [Nocardia sp. NPDC047038]|uniref:hypothetical protein n=1 Tax=Nocardia sp. NPDC047038 TaxID=3154338 RepID=UPI0033F260A1